MLCTSTLLSGLLPCPLPVPSDGFSAAEVVAPDALLAPLPGLWAAGAAVTNVRGLAPPNVFLAAKAATLNGLGDGISAADAKPTNALPNPLHGLSAAEGAALNALLGPLDGFSAPEVAALNALLGPLDGCSVAWAAVPNGSLDPPKGPSVVAFAVSVFVASSLFVVIVAAFCASSRRLSRCNSESWSLLAACLVALPSCVSSRRLSCGWQ